MYAHLTNLDLKNPQISEIWMLMIQNNKNTTVRFADTHIIKVEEASVRVIHADIPSIVALFNVM